MSYCWSSSRWSSWWSFNRCPVVGPPEISPADDLLIGPVDGPPDDGPVDLPKGVLFLVIQKIVQLMIFQKMSCWWSSMRWSGWWSFKRCPHVGQSVDGPVDDIQIGIKLLVSYCLLFCFSVNCKILSFIKKNVIIFTFTIAVWFFSYDLLIIPCY